MSDPRHTGGRSPRPLPPPTPRPARQVARRRDDAVRRRRRVVTAFTLVLLVTIGTVALRDHGRRAVVGHTGSASATPSRDAPHRRLQAVGVASCVFFERSGVTQDYLTHVSIPGRRLVTDVYYPASASRSHGGALRDAAPALGRAPYPTVFFAEGYGIDPSSYARLLEAWVRAGLVVVAPMFPDANAATVSAIHRNVADEEDMVYQPGDLAFVTRRVLADSAGTGSGCRVLHGLVDASELGLAGQSDGATTVGMLAYDLGTIPGGSTTYRSLSSGLDYKAVVLLSGEAYGDDPYGASPSSPPALVVQSATDACNPPVESVDLYAALAGTQRWFLGLRHADHLTPYEGQDASGFAVVARVTSAFLSGELRGARLPASFLASGNADPKVAELVSGPDVPGFVDVTVNQSKAACYQT